MLELREQLVTSRNRTWDGVNNCTSITIHETANTRPGADAQAHANLQSNGNPRSASWHIQVDDTDTIRSFPDDVQCWHSGTKEGNTNSVAIEICVNADGDYNLALVNAAKVVAGLRDKHNLGRDAVKQHHDWNGKNCPSRMRATGAWDLFVASTDPQPAVKPPTVNTSGQGAGGMGGGRSVRTMALEVLAGLHGNGHDVRRQSLAVSTDLYGQVRAEVNRLATGTTPPTIPVTVKSVAQMAAEVIDGKHGQGHPARRRSLKVSIAVYEQVRAEVNRRLRVPAPVRPVKSVSQMASEVLAGLHGNGHETRRRSLGVSTAVYGQVRAEVNRRA